MTISTNSFYCVLLRHVMNKYYHTKLLSTVLIFYNDDFVQERTENMKARTCHKYTIYRIHVKKQRNVVKHLTFVAFNELLVGNMFLASLQYQLVTLH